KSANSSRGLLARRGARHLTRTPQAVTAGAMARRDRRNPEQYDPPQRDVTVRDTTRSVTSTGAASAKAFESDPVRSALHGMRRVLAICRRAGAFLRFWGLDAIAGDDARAAVAAALDGASMRFSSR